MNWWHIAALWFSCFAIVVPTGLLLAIVYLHVFAWFVIAGGISLSSVLAWKKMGAGDPLKEYWKEVNR